MVGDDDQGFGVDDVELSRDLTTVVGIAGQSDEKLRVYRTTMHPFGAPDWDHTPLHQGNVPVAQRCYELPGKFESTTLAPSGRALAYGTAEGIFVAGIPDACAPGAPATPLIPGGRFPDWGPAEVPATSGAAPATAPQPRPAKLRMSITRAGKVTLTVPAPGKVTVTATRKRRTLATVRAKAKSAGKVTVRLPRKARGKVTIKATFRPAGGAPQTASKTLMVRG